MRFQTNNLRRRAKFLFLLFSIVFFPVFVWLGFDAVRLLYFYPPVPHFTTRLPKGTLSPVFATITYEDKEHNLLLIDEKRNIFLLIDNESGIVDYTGCNPNHDWPPESLTLSFDKSGILQNNEDGYLHKWGIRLAPPDYFPVSCVFQWYPWRMSASVTGCVATACSNSRRNNCPRLREERRLNRKVNSSKYDWRCSIAKAP